MFEAHVLYLLRKYLGEYVEGLSTEALRISVWKGDVVLKDLKLKAEALNSLRLPVTVKAGFVGTITLKVPWKSLGKDPVVVLIDRVFVLAHPTPEGQVLKEEDREKLFEAKLQQIEVAEAATIEASTRSSKEASAHGGNSWLHSFVSTIIGNLKVTISNVHIRYEDSFSNFGHPFCCGITLEKLAAVTVDEAGNETFDTSGALDKLHKSMQLQRLAVYHDSDSSPWKVDNRWEDLNPVEWAEIFLDGIDGQSGYSVSVWSLNRQFLVSPINGVLIYRRLGKQERGNFDVPYERASFVLDDVSLTLTEAQYYDGIKLLETFSRFRTCVDVSHLRPAVPVSKDPCSWWRYAMLASLQQKKLCYWFSWKNIKDHCQLRRCYVQLYAASLQQSPTEDVSAMRKIEKVLDSKVILLWRLLAHAKVETVKSKEASLKKSASKKSWWSLGWYTSNESTDNTASEEHRLGDETFTNEEWLVINKLLSYQLDENVTYQVGKSSSSSIYFLLDVSIRQSAARIIDIDGIEVLCGSFQELCVATKLYPKTIQCEVSLKYCGLSSPEGSLAESVFSERKRNALDACFVRAPIGENLDWQLSAKISPCHVTILMASYERFLEFMKRSNDVSPKVAMETANVLQIKLEQVTRRAQEQLQIVLEEQSRFGLDIDFDAPKVKIPLTSSSSPFASSHFLLDFGHFTLQTRDILRDEEMQSLYSRFFITGRDIAAFLIDDTSLGGVMNSNEDNFGTPQAISGCDDIFCSLLDPCGMSVIVDQIKRPYPNYPSMRIFVQVPLLGIHFSPKRYSKIMKLLDILYSSNGSSNQETKGGGHTGAVPWYPADLAGFARVIVWRGLGNSMAEWHPCYLALSRLHLYVLESESSSTYQRFCSMAGRHVFEVPSTNVGGSRYAIAVSSRGGDCQKSLESRSTLIIEFQNELEKSVWLKQLTQATYSASALPELNVLGESVGNSPRAASPRGDSFGVADLVVTGTVVETKMSIYGKVNSGTGTTKEMLLLEVLGNVGKINLAKSSGGLTVKAKLHSLNIKDELLGRLSTMTKYLACSAMNEKGEIGSCGDGDKEKEAFSLAEEDSFKDALPDFVSTSCSGTPIAHTDLVDSNICSLDGDLIGNHDEVFYEAQDSNITDFITLIFLTRTSDSDLYDGIDTQMDIRMSALDFYCNRPTLVALIEFGLNVSMVNSGQTNDNSVVFPVSVDTAEKADIPDKEDSQRSLVKGFLGYGKARVVFNLKMDVGRVSVFLNKEDDLQLAMFVQETFLLDLKVHPGSICIDGTLGNMRLRDMSLGLDHHWSWLCDIRNPGVESLIKFTFKSYSIEDDDYEGHVYSLSGRLSAVRIVFLYRFVQEIMAYFMELATPHTEEAIKFIDKVGGLEWLIQKYEIDGASAIKFDLSLDNPIIIIPKNSDSKDYMQLDLGQLRVTNNFSWHGDKDNDPSAIHLDTLHIEMKGINMVVGVNGTLGKLMIRKGDGINIEVKRSLRDVFRKVPTLSLKVQVGLLRGVMSDKEYNVIINCVSMNLSELPNLPPSFRGNMNRAKESIRLLADRVNINSQMLSRTVILIAVDIQYAILDLCNGPDAESPLAAIALENLWVSYRSTSLSEMDVYLSVSNFCVLDIRPDTKPEMRLMLGSYSDSFKLDKSNISASTVGLRTNIVSGGILENRSCMDPSNLTMLILDYRWRSTFQSFVLRIQQPRILFVLDFLLPVVEYFVPSLGSITGREEFLNPKSDPLINSDDIILSEPTYFQKDKFIYLSPGRQLIVDGFGIDDFIYDGCGGTIFLTLELDGKSYSNCGALIYIASGKKLRFKNVKIENGALLRSCVYLHNGSSYSVASEDGVEISLLETIMDIDDDLSQQDDEDKVPIVPDVAAEDSANQMFNVIFEAQVISPEFTFYDNSKLSADDSLYIEKLLRAKMDLSFMYASKGKDVWARSMIKDLRIEAGSGLLVLEPVDISGGYTSVRDKTNISLTSSDVCLHLSLSCASLLLKLQSQTNSALQFGNTSPLVSCTNFKRVWASPKGNLHGHNLSFWRPQAPSNYAVLGDCVTSRTVPPSQVVVAVSNAYGRVRKPIGFKFICFVPSSGKSDSPFPLSDDNNCSIWLPIPPPGYSAVGCIAHIGAQPPPNHIVYCLRSDLVTSSKFSDCIYLLPSVPGVSSGLSIWRADNIVGSFYVYNSEQFPQETKALNLHQILLRNPNHFFHKKHSSDTHVTKERDGDQLSVSKMTSGWDVVRSLSRPSSYYMSTPQLERIWWDKGGDQRRPISIWRPLHRPGYSSVGDCLAEGLEPPALGLVFKRDNSTISARPTHFTKVSHVVGKGLDEAFFWYPVPPPGYVSMGCIVTTTDEMPSKDSLCCPRIDLVNQSCVSDEPISRSSSSKGISWSIWKVENQACSFLARSDLWKPSIRLAYAIIEYAKPKKRENVTAELKLNCLSVGLLDNSCGMMTPLFDTTITNINLASHGRFEAMNAVLICSMSASTFNRQLEAWEPLIESFDGIFKLETYENSENLSLRRGKRVRVAASTPVNFNFSAANIETVLEMLVSWRRQEKMENRSFRRSEEIIGTLDLDDDFSYSALDEEEFQKVIIENKLGCDVYLRRMEPDIDSVELLQDKMQITVLMPPPQFSDKLNVVAKPPDRRHYIAVQILETEGFPIIDDGNGYDVFCALRLLMDSTASERYKLFPQSARTRCVTPLITGEDKSPKGHAKWNELFIFEVPEKGLATLELEVTNLASKTGKGEVVGALSIPIGHGSMTLKRAVSMKMLQQAALSQKVVSYPLVKKGQADGKKESGFLLVSTSYIERPQANFHTGRDDIDFSFFIGLTPDGPWESFSSVLPLSTVPKTLEQNPFALEVTPRNGKKHVVLRSLAAITNYADVKLEVAVCPISVLTSSILNLESSSLTVVEDEVFENQQYHPISGWGTKMLRLGGNEVETWSTRDFSYSSKDFFEPPLPSGWRWTSPWKIDKLQHVDNDGWAYATDFQSLKWPPSSNASIKSSTDFVRRRRWLRLRQQGLDKSIDTISVIDVIDPQSSALLPWTSTVKDLDLCLLIRPFSENSPETYNWGQFRTFNPANQSDMQLQLSRQSTIKQPISAPHSSILRLAELEKKDLLLHCSSSWSIKQHCWFSIGVDASVLNTERNFPVCDWKISIHSVMILENKLPYEAEYSIWEKSGDSNMIERQHSVVLSGQSAFVCSTDIRKSIYLTLVVQGGWVLEKDAVLIMDLANLQQASSFWMIQTRTRRRVRVSLELDMGGTDAAPKTIRLFVPYWIQNDSLLPLVYRIVEVDPSEMENTGSLTRAAKSGKFTFRQSSKSLDRRSISLRKNSQVLEVIDDTSMKWIMLSPQDHLSLSGVLPFQFRSSDFTSRIGVSVAVGSCSTYSTGISFLDLESKEYVDVKAFKADGSYYWLSGHLKMTSDRTKVIHFVPRELFINRIGFPIVMSQCNTESDQKLSPSDAPKLFLWQPTTSDELLKLQLEGRHWSSQFSVETEGVVCVPLKSVVGNNQMYVKVQIRSGAKASRHEVLFQFASSLSPYRIENRSMFSSVRFRQMESSDYSWHILPPNSAAAFFWENLSRQRQLEVLADGAEPENSKTYDIDRVMDHQPEVTSTGRAKPLFISVVKEGKMRIIKICDWMPENQGHEQMHEISATPIFMPSEVESNQSEEIESELHATFELPELGISIIDHMPEEILYLSVQKLVLAYSSGFGSGFNGFELRMGWIQVDNQLPFTPMPVLFTPQRVENQVDSVLKFSMAMQTNNALDFHVYQFISLQVPDYCTFLVNIHEPIIWRIHEMLQHVKYGQAFDSQSAAVSVDPTIGIGSLYISEIRFRVSMSMAPAQRPRGVLGFWSSLMTALGNMEHMPVRIAHRNKKDISMRQSSLSTAAISSVQKDLLSQPFHLLSGVDILGNASSALSNMSKGIAALSMDKKFIQGRQKQDSKGVEDITDVIREGGGALAKGFFRGVTGILTKPLEGAKASGVEGFVHGVGKGLIGAAAQPVSGVLDLLSKTTEGANAVKMKISSAISAEEQLARRRLPRVISGDNLLRPYDEYKADGQAILQLAESGTFLGQVDLFKVRGKFAFSDAYEYHFVLPKSRILVITHRRALLLQQPATQKKFNPAKDPCSVIWDVLWDDLVTMELTRGKKDAPGSLPSRLILYLQTRQTDYKDSTRVLKCKREDEQATIIYSNIQETLKFYGPDSSKGAQKRKVPRPYTPIGANSSSDVFSREDFGSWNLQEDQKSVPLDPSFGMVHD